MGGVLLQHGVDETLGDAAEAETTDEQLGAVVKIVQRIRSRVVDLAIVLRSCGVEEDPSVLWRGE